MIIQKEFTLPGFKRGFHIITDIVTEVLGDLPESGILNLFILHTSAALSINENYDPTVLDDFHSFFNKLVPDDISLYTHIDEGSDDMPAHIKSSIMGSSLNIPIVNGRLHLGTWQGIYLCEFRNSIHRRKLIATIYH
ncbi:MAG: secondary thiamine-phosphate synthase enzyme YjbQ [Saprospiraceae bacterium]